MFLAAVGVIAILIVLFKVLHFAYQHFVVTTDLKVYGAKQGAWAVITGASEGIGKGFALALAQKGFNIVIISRREESLKPVADEASTKYGVQTKIVPLDCNSKDAVTQLVTAVNGLDVSVLVNNVGLNTRYPEMLVDTPDNEIDSMLNVNIAFTTKLTKAFIPSLSKRRSIIFNMSSFTGRCPVAMMSVYSATKAYVDVFSRALAAELKPSGIDVTSVLPHYVVSVMSGIRKPSLMIPEAVPFANMTLKQAGCGSYSVAPHWGHDLTMKIVDMLPDFYVGKSGFKKMQFVRKRLMERDEREKNKSK